MEIARRVDFPVGARPARKDPRRALLPGALALGIALAVVFAAGRIHRQQPTEVEEREPNDAPSAASGPHRYPVWLEVARQNVLGDADVVRARTGGDDVDTFAVEPHDGGLVPDAVLLVPQRGLALEVSAWSSRGRDPRSPPRETTSPSSGRATRGSRSWLDSPACRPPRRPFSSA